MNVLNTQIFTIFNFRFLNNFLNVDDKYLKSKYNYLDNLQTCNVNGTELFDKRLAFKILSKCCQKDS